MSKERIEAAKKIDKERRVYTKDEREKVIISLTSVATNVLAAPFIGMSIDEKPTVIKYIAGAVLLAFAAVSGIFLGNSLADLKSKKEEFNKNKQLETKDEDKELSI